MSGERIDHAAEAQRIMGLAQHEQGHKWRSDHQMKRAWVHATLALVEQQRIANLIALLSGSGDTAYVMNGELNVYNRDNWESVRAEIRKGLGP